MSKNSPTTTPGIEKFISRVAAAEKGQQKEIRLTLQEAKELVTDLALMSSRLTSTINDIHKMLKEVKTDATQIEVKFDGGGF